MKTLVSPISQGHTFVNTESALLGSASRTTTTTVPGAASVADGRRAVLSKVLDETRRFRAALPSLVERHAGQWVVFKDGCVASVHASLDEAYRSGLRAFGPLGGHVVDRVEYRTAIPATAGVVFG
jgi:hypothetical protein